MVNHFYDDRYYQALNLEDVRESCPPEDFKKVSYTVPLNSESWGTGGVSVPSFAYKYSEGKSIEEFSKYIRDTYGAHYKGENNIQAFDIWEARTGDPTEVHACTGMKYLFRYGKKHGYNRDDILKTMHYCLMLLHYHDKFHKENK